MKFFALHTHWIEAQKTSGRRLVPILRNEAPTVPLPP